MQKRRHQLRTVSGCVIHRGHARRLLTRVRFNKRTVDDAAQICVKQVVQQRVHISVKSNGVVGGYRETGRKCDPHIGIVSTRYR